MFLRILFAYLEENNAAHLEIIHENGYSVFEAVHFMFGKCRRVFMNVHHMYKKY